MVTGAPMKTQARQRKAAMGLSPALRKYIEKLAADTPAHVVRMLAAEREAIGTYASITQSDLARDVHAATTAHARIWYNSLLAGRMPSAKELEPFTEVGRRRMHQGFDLPTLLHAVRLAAIVLWNTLLDATRENPAVRTEMLFKVSPFLLLHFDLFSQALSRGFMEEGQQRARWRERLQNELCDLLFSRPDDLPRFRELARALDLDAAASYAALAIRLGGGRGAPQPQEPADVEALLDKVTPTLGATAATVVTTFRHGLLLLWLPAPRGELLVTQEQLLAQKARGLIGNKSGVAAVGVGLPAAGPGGWRESADQAQQALEVGRSLGTAEAVHRYAELALDDAVRGSRGVTRYLASLLERLAAEPALLETLEAFFRHRQHRKACAGDLGIHINTLAYRLERIESLLGAQLDDPSWLARLHAAVRLGSSRSAK